MSDHNKNNDQKQRLETIGQFAGGIAHDFNNILSIIEGYADMAARRLESGADCSEHIAKIIETAHRGGEITRQLLSFSQFNVALGDAVEVNTLIAEQEMLITPTLGHDIECVLDMSPENIYIECAREHIAQICLNMATNARDAMPSGGCFSIRVMNIGDQVCLRFSDTGEGISPEIMERIFDPFFTTKSYGSGTGLGLSTVYGLVQLMDGDIQVKSNMGQGTEFEIYLPKTELRPEYLDITEEDNQNQKQTVFHQPMELQGRTILIAEDEPDLRLVLSEMMTGLKMSVLTAGGGGEALDIQQRHRGKIDFLLTDIVMPEMNGGDLAQQFCQLRPETHIVFMSGYPAPGYGNDVFIPSDAVLINKPVRHERVVQALRSCLQYG